MFFCNHVLSNWFSVLVRKIPKLISHIGLFPTFYLFTSMAVPQKNVLMKRNQVSVCVASGVPWFSSVFSKMPCSFPSNRRILYIFWMGGILCIVRLLIYIESFHSLPSSRWSCFFSFLPFFSFSKKYRFLILMPGKKGNIRSNPYSRFRILIYQF